MLTSLTSTYSRICLSAAKVRVRLRRRFADVRLAHDLDERNAGAIQVDRRCAGKSIVNRLAGVFLHVHARDAEW